MKTDFTKRLKAIHQQQVEIFKEMEAQPENWDDVPKDTLILVRDKTGEPWKKRYFSRAGENGLVCFHSGCTSKTAQHEQTWCYGMLIKEEESC